MAHNVIVFPAWRIELSARVGTPAADVPTLDDFLASVREMRAELAQCQDELNECQTMLVGVRAGIAEVREEVSDLIKQIVKQSVALAEGPEEETVDCSCGACSCGDGCTCEGMCPCGFGFELPTRV